MMVDNSCVIPMMVEPLNQLTEPCKNCYGTGTVFQGKTLRVGNSKRCPVCKGTCKVPYEGKLP